MQSQALLRERIERLGGDSTLPIELSDPTPSSTHLGVDDSVSDRSDSLFSPFEAASTAIEVSSEIDPGAARAREHLKMAGVPPTAKEKTLEQTFPEPRVPTARRGMEKGKSAEISDAEAQAEAEAEAALELELQADEEARKLLEAAIASGSEHKLIAAIAVMQERGLDLDDARIDEARVRLEALQQANLQR